MNGPRVTIYTAAFAGYDRVLEPQAQTVPVRWVFFNDGTLEFESNSIWKSVLQPRRMIEPRMDAKLYKLMPWRFGIDGPSVWIDANMRVISETFAEEALTVLAAAPVARIALFAHNARDCIYEEAIASLRLAPEKYEDQPLLEQVESYRREHHPEHWGLWAGGVILRDLADYLVRELCTAWLGECVVWSYQDQLSLPVVARRLGLRPAAVPFGLLEGPWLGNRWVQIGSHNRND